ncbi:MAG: hypothetical protein RL710_653, partial [Pseudomonadota bacterium]
LSCLPGLAGLFFFEPLTPGKLLTAMLLGLVSVVWFEVIKFVRRVRGL